MAALVELTLAPEPSSAGAARRAVAAALRGQGTDEDLVDTVALLVSEVVTNAVLHAGTEVLVRCEADTTSARVEVKDESPVVPSTRHHGEDSTTGRGLGLLEALAAASGIELLPTGKVVWFVVGEERGSVLGGGGAAQATYAVRFLDMHVPMTRSALAYGEAVLRELALMTINGDSDGDGRWRAPRFNLAPLLDALETANGRGQVVATIDVEFPLDAKELSLERLALVEEGHDLACQGKLLALPAVPEAMHYRRWVYRQIHQQAEGAPPEPWIAPEDTSEERVVLEPADQAALDGANAVVAADDGNRIVFASSAVSALLGWEPDELVGRRLTALIPSEWRLAHLAGFVRFQLTGESRIIGNAVVVPAARRDGTTVDVRLRIDPVAIRGGRVFRATLEPVDPAGPVVAAAPLPDRDGES